MDNNTIQVKNLTEDFVDAYLDDCIKSSGICSCDICRADVRAYALNRLKPRYVASISGDTMASHSAQTSQGTADIIAAIMEGTKIVGGNPRHKAD